MPKAAFPPQELSPGTRNFGVVLGLVCLHCRNQGLNEVPGKNFPHRKSLLAR